MNMNKTIKTGNAGSCGSNRGIGKWFSALLLVIASVWIVAEAAASGNNMQTAYLVVAGDRGFIGNEEIIDEFQLFAGNRNASLVFVTAERTDKSMRAGVSP